MFCGLLSTVIGTKKPLQIILPFCPYLCLDLAFIDHIVFRSTCFKYSWLPLVHRLFVTSPNLSGLILSFSVNTRLHIIRDSSFVEKRSQSPFFTFVLILLIEKGNTVFVHWYNMESIFSFFYHKKISYAPSLFTIDSLQVPMCESILPHCYCSFLLETK